jgi:hypothetical protein
LRWIKSTLSYANGNCVEVAEYPGGDIGIRDSKNADGPSLRVSSEEWLSFLAGVRNNEFEMPETARR